MKWIDVDDMQKPVHGNQYMIKYDHRGDVGIAIARYNGREDKWCIATPWCGAQCYEHIAIVTHRSSVPVNGIFSCG